MITFKETYDGMLDQNVNGSYIVSIIKPWATIERIYTDDNAFVDYQFEDVQEAHEFFNWAVADDYSSDIDDGSLDCLD